MNDLEEVMNINARKKREAREEIVSSIVQLFARNKREEAHPNAADSEHEHGESDHDDHDHGPNTHRKIGYPLVFGFVFMLLVDQISNATGSRNDRSGRNRMGISATIGLVVHSAG
ncbi:hypothetical protein OESDEN_04440 [Oesophagostomum dentatum]|uniref:Uncharacterized protein n=1 Tax=Oesophagostomum dentatum TaxID=61180 RepID=A0A0B1THQ9_OESDE|nr:hypothetical protein OESDEN_04440 [Oesophagostomum dentatum]